MEFSWENLAKSQLTCIGLKGLKKTILSAAFLSNADRKIDIIE